MVGNFALTGVVDAEGRPARVVAGSAATAAVLTLVVLPPSSLRLEDELAVLPVEDPCAALARAESALVAAAEQDRRATAWWNHVVVVAFNVGLGLVLGLGYDRWTNAALQMGVGSAIGETMLLTRPVPSIELLRDYRAR